MTTRFAKEMSKQINANTYPVQHHHAHLAALLADHAKSKDSNIVCIAIDGVGYGLDGMAWGGEILLGGYHHFERLGQLKYQPMPGGDLCAKYPARMLASILSTFMDESEIIEIFNKNYVKYLKHGFDELHVILKQSKDNGALKTSGLGRLLDSISALLGVCWLRTYEGEPPMRLESFASRDKSKTVTLRLPISQRKEKYILDTSELMLSLIENINTKKENLAYEALQLLGRQLANAACTIADENNIHEIGLVGGSAVNSILLKNIKETINNKKKQFLFYKTIPCGDGGISTGQALVAASEK
jgi:hydrogenase maturation protein HypF